MKKALLILFVTLASFAAQAQELEWHTDVAKATALSQKTKSRYFIFYGQRLVWLVYEVAKRGA
jgi:protein disulfide-isomerase